LLGTSPASGSGGCWMIRTVAKCRNLDSAGLVPSKLL
jgi:hypothetical protein